jgi:hypothetical protein
MAILFLPQFPAFFFFFVVFCALFRLFSTFVKDECLFTLFMPRQDRMSKPKPERYNYTGAVACGLTPMTDHPDQKKWFDYGRETGLLTLRYLETKDVTLLPEIMQRCETEANAWLGMDPPDYAGAAKQWQKRQKNSWRGRKEKKTERLFTESIDAACEERLVFPSTSNQSYSS